MVALVSEAAQLRAALLAASWNMQWFDVGLTLAAERTRTTLPVSQWSESVYERRWDGRRGSSRIFRRMMTTRERTEASQGQVKWCCSV